LDDDDLWGGNIGKPTTATNAKNPSLIRGTSAPPPRTQNNSQNYTPQNISSSGLGLKKQSSDEDFDDLVNSALGGTSKNK
jgi:hypothetical protein